MYDDNAVSSKSDQNKWVLGRILRIRNRERGVVEYYKPINLSDTRKYAKVFLTVNLYNKQENVFTNTSTNVDVVLKDVIMKVNLVCKDTEDSSEEDTIERQFVLSQHDANTLTDFVRNTRSVSRTSQRRNTAVENSGPDDGRICITVSPTQNPEDDSRRRSTRRRNIQLWAYS